MLVRQFLQWLRTAPASERAGATAALARAYLFSGLSPDERAAAAGAMTMLLDDPSPLVRRALAEVLADSDQAPPTVIHALAHDQPDVAALVLERSPLLVDVDLVDIAARGGPVQQMAIARRPLLPRAVSAALAEIGCAEACLALAENRTAEIVPFSHLRMVERFGHLGFLRNALLDRTDLPASARQALVAKLSQTLADFVTKRQWLEAERAHNIAKEACEKATVTLAAASPAGELRSLIRHLRESGQLTAGLLLRALLSGNITLFEQALAELSGLASARVAGIVHDRRGNGLRALFAKAGLPASTYPAFRAALEAMHEESCESPQSCRLKRRMIERVLTRCESAPFSEVAPLLTLLRRFAGEAAREEARLMCDAMVEGSVPVLAGEPQRFAA